MSLLLELLVRIDTSVICRLGSVGDNEMQNAAPGRNVRTQGGNNERDATASPEEDDNRPARARDAGSEAPDGDEFEEVRYNPSNYHHLPPPQTRPMGLEPLPQRLVYPLLLTIGNLSMEKVELRQFICRLTDMIVDDKCVYCYILDGVEGNCDLPEGCTVHIAIHRHLQDIGRARRAFERISTADGCCQTCTMSLFFCLKSFRGSESDCLKSKRILEAVAVLLVKSRSFRLLIFHLMRLQVPETGEELKAFLAQPCIFPGQTCNKLFEVTWIAMRVCQGYTEPSIPARLLARKPTPPPWITRPEPSVDAVISDNGARRRTLPWQPHQAKIRLVDGLDLVGMEVDGVRLTYDQEAGEVQGWLTPVREQRRHYMRTTGQNLPPGSLAEMEFMTGTTLEPVGHECVLFLEQLSQFAHSLCLSACFMCKADLKRRKATDQINGVTDSWVNCRHHHIQKNGYVQLPKNLFDTWVLRYKTSSNDMPSSTCPICLFPNFICNQFSDDPANSRYLDCRVALSVLPVLFFMEFCPSSSTWNDVLRKMAARDDYIGVKPTPNSRVRMHLRHDERFGGLPIANALRLFHYFAAQHGFSSSC